MDTSERVRKIVAGILNVNVDQVTPEASLFNDLGADSLTMVEISMAVEEEFGLKLDDEEAFALQTVRQIASRIEAHNAPANVAVAGAVR